MAIVSIGGTPGATPGQRPNRPIGLLPLLAPYSAGHKALEIFTFHLRFRRSVTSTVMLEIVGLISDFCRLYWPRVSIHRSYCDTE